MNLARVLVTICIVFLLCNSLRLFLGLQAIINVNITIQCAAINKAWIPPSWMLIMESISHLLLLFSSSSNFLIYCTISTRFKIFFKRKFFFRYVMAKIDYQEEGTIPFCYFSNSKFDFDLKKVKVKRCNFVTKKIRFERRRDYINCAYIRYNLVVLSTINQIA